MSVDNFRVAAGISGWLKAEIQTSDAPNSPNKFLSDYKTARPRLIEEVGLGANYLLEKYSSHTNRFRRETSGFMAAFLDDPTNEDGFSQLFFAALMKLSGNIRDHAIVSTNNQDDYETIRRMRCSIWPTELIPTTMAAPFTSEEIYKSAQRNVVQPHIIAVDKIVEAANTDALLGTLPNHFINLGRGTLDFCVDMARFGSKTFGNLEAIPALEPFSITSNPGLIHPFNLEKWAEYIPSNPQYLDATTD